MYNPYLNRAGSSVVHPGETAGDPREASRLSRLWSRLKPDSLDTGDVLLLLILLFLLLEEEDDDPELLLTLGLTLLQ